MKEVFLLKNYINHSILSRFKNEDMIFNLFLYQLRRKILFFLRRENLAIEIVFIFYFNKKNINE